RTSRIVGASAVPIRDQSSWGETKKLAEDIGLLRLRRRRRLGLASLTGRPSQAPYANISRSDSPEQGCPSHRGRQHQRNAGPEQQDQNHAAEGCVIELAVELEPAPDAGDQRRERKRIELHRLARIRA